MLCALCEILQEKASFCMPLAFDATGISSSSSWSSKVGVRFAFFHNCNYWSYWRLNWLMNRNMGILQFKILLRKNSFWSLSLRNNSWKIYNCKKSAHQHRSISLYSSNSSQVRVIGMTGDETLPVLLFHVHISLESQVFCSILLWMSPKCWLTRRRGSKTCRTSLFVQGHNIGINYGNTI